MPSKTTNKKQNPFDYDTVTRIFSNVHKQVEPIFFKRVERGKTDIT